MNTDALNTIDEALLDGVSGGTFSGCGPSLGGLIGSKLKLVAGIVSCGLAVVGSVLSCLIPSKGC